MNYSPLTGGDLAAFVSLTLKVLLYMNLHAHWYFGFDRIQDISFIRNMKNLILHILLHIAIALFTFQILIIHCILIYCCLVLLPLLFTRCHSVEVSTKFIEFIKTRIVNMSHTCEHI